MTTLHFKPHDLSTNEGILDKVDEDIRDIKSERNENIERLKSGYNWKRDIYTSETKRQLLADINGYYDEKIKKATNVPGYGEALKEADEWMEKVNGNKEEREELEKRMGMPKELIEYRGVWEEKILLNQITKSKIICAADRIMSRTINHKGFHAKKESDGSFRIEFPLNGKYYTLVDLNVGAHTDKDYTIHVKHHRGVVELEKDYTKLKGVFGDNPKNWKNLELSEEVIQRSNMIHIGVPKIEEMRALLDELGKEAGITKENEKIAMLSYLTGMNGDYWLSMGDTIGSNPKSKKRPMINCDIHGGNFITLADSPYAGMVLFGCKSA